MSADKGVSAVKSPLLPVADALAAALASIAGPTAIEQTPLSEAPGRTLAQDVAALLTQPPFDASAMDGYALRAVDGARAGVSLRVIGEAAAGGGFTGSVGSGEAVRIFTGAPVPAGADTVVMQENTQADQERVTLTQPTEAGRHIRRAGVDFAAGAQLLRAGQQLDFRHIGLAAAMGHGTLPLRRKPVVALLATGDELVAAGVTPGPGQIVSSNSHSIAALVLQAGASPLDLGIAADATDAIAAAIARAQAAGADILVTLGGASVGAHDLVRQALSEAGMDLGFWRIAMRPGKPLIHGKLGGMSVLGLPGNPASAIVCALVFLRPMIRALLGDPAAGSDISIPVRLGAAMPANEGRQDYMRVRLSPGADLPVAVSAGLQDSSLLSVMTQADGLLVRPPHAPAASVGDIGRVLIF